LVSDQVFFSFALAIIGLFVTIAIAVITILHKIYSEFSSLKKDISNISKAVTEVLSPFRVLGDYIQHKGIQGLAQELVSSLKGLELKEPKDPLAPEKVKRRNELIQASKTRKLTQGEAAELKAILEEEARIQLAEGIITFLGFLALLGLIGLFIAAISSSRD
jgi:predicted PurR-regulated permease PerM